MSAEFDEGLERGDELPYFPTVGKNWVLAGRLAAFDILPAHLGGKTFDYSQVHELIQLAYVHGVLAAQGRGGAL